MKRDLDDHRYWIGGLIVFLALGTMVVEGITLARQGNQIDCQVQYAREFSAVFDTRVHIEESDRAAEDALSRARLEHGIDSAQARLALAQFIDATSRNIEARRSNPYPEYQC